MQYPGQLRLNSASRKLRDSADAIARIAFDVGYESEAAFNRAFKREFGTPPAAWRKAQTGPEEATAYSVSPENDPV